MKTTCSAILSVLLLCVSCGLSSAPAVDASGAKKGVWSSDYAAVRAAAKAAKAPVFLLFTGSDWCGWCKLMERKVFSTPEWQTFAAETLYLAYIDFPQRTEQPEALHNQNVRLQEEFNVEGFPTMILLDADGNQTATFSASREVTAEGFVKEVRKALQFTDATVESLLKTFPAAEADEIRRMAKACEAFREEAAAAQKEFEAKIQALSLESMKNSLYFGPREGMFCDLKTGVRLQAIKASRPERYEAYRTLTGQFKTLAEDAAKAIAGLQGPMTPEAQMERLAPLGNRLEELQQKRREFLKTLDDTP